MRTIATLALAAALLLAPGLPARAHTADTTFPFSTGEGPACMEPLDLAYTPRMEVWFPADTEPAHRQKLLGILAEHLMYLPPGHRATLKQVVFDPGSYPRARYKARELGRESFKAAGIALPGAIVFYRNPPAWDWLLVRSLVFHEMGHVYAMAKFGSSAPPAAWSAAARQDGNFLSAYARDSFNAAHTYVEDFAEAYEAFYEARLRGGDLPDRYKQRYPYRFGLLETYTY